MATTPVNPAADGSDNVATFPGAQSKHELWLLEMLDMLAMTAAGGKNTIVTPQGARALLGHIVKLERRSRG